MDKYQTGLRRFIAIFIDSLILLPLDSLANIIWQFKLPVEAFFIWASIYSISYVFYFIIMHAVFGQTIGKWVCKVKVVDNASENRITYKQAILRDIVPFLLIPYSIYIYGSSYSAWLSDETIVQAKFDYILTFALYGWAWLEIITMLMNKKRRAAHDFIAGTVVIKVSNKSLNSQATPARTPKSGTL